MTFPSAEDVYRETKQVPSKYQASATQVTTQVEELLKVFTGEHTRQDLQEKLRLANRENFRKNYLQPALESKVIEMTIPEKPQSSKQRYRLTSRGVQAKKI
ncbi:ATP-dependent DNA helicase RecG [Salegentibacter salinarum]|nr:ATP-dependent DNA helicase RecG [Salegentibacter salinarum]